MPEQIPHMSANPGSFYVTPSSIVGIKKEKLEPDAYTDPSTPTRCGNKRKDAEHVTPPLSKRFATKQDIQETFTPSKPRGRST